MNYFRRSAAVFLSVVIAASGGAPASAKAEPEQSQTTTAQPELIYVEFTEPIPVADVIRAAEKANLDLRELRLHGDVTAVMYTAGVPWEDMAAKYQSLISSGSRGQVPAVATGVVLNVGRSSQDLKSLELPIARIKASKSPIEWVTGGFRGNIKRGEGSSERASSPESEAAWTTFQKTGYAFPRLDVLFAQGDAREVEYRLYPRHSVAVSGGTHNFQWDNALWDDWGYEADFKQYNETDTMPGIRPACLNTSNDRLFWAARGSSPEIAGYYTDIPSVARPYFDGNDALDNCSNLDLSMGIGRPALLPAVSNPNVYFSFTLWAYRGTKISNIFSLKQQRISNDCNDIGAEENSDCMGLNDQRPGSGSEVPIDKDFDRQQVPFCAEYLGDLGGVHAYAEKVKEVLALPNTYTRNCSLT